MTSSDKKITVAVDGYSSSGKSTMARRLAAAVGYRYIDSGAMYRAVTLKAMRAALIAPDGTVDEPGLLTLLPSTKIDFAVGDDGRQATLLNGENVEKEIRSMAVSSNVSAVSAIPEVRHALTAMQRDLGCSKGIVMDGRDIGTTVFPDAELKVFVDASPETRARRRLLELQGKGDNSVSYEEVLANITARDHLDRTRKESPLRCASDAVRFDNSGMTLAEQDDLMLKLFNDAVKRQEAE